MENNKYKSIMNCDPASGICEVPGIQTEGFTPDLHSDKKPVRLLYFTDPICSSCWGIEPQLRKLKLEYGDYFDVEYRMGGLLKSWDSYGGRDVSGPKSVAQHWEEAAAHYQMPIDGDIWLEDPLESSYPPSIAFKAAQLQDEEKALVFLRRIKEMVFLEKKNITKLEYLESAARQSGLDVAQFNSDYQGKAEDAFNEDLQLTGQLGVRGFPSIFFLDEDGNRFLVYGSKDYGKYEEALLKLYPDAKKRTYDTTLASLFDNYPSFTTREFSELSGNSMEDSERLLNSLVEKNQLRKQESNNGPLWIKI